MGFKLVRVDSTEPYKFSLTLGSHFIGRGKFLDCNDNRVSRNHAELIVTSDSMLLKSLHQNPCFLKKKSGTETIVFSQPDSQILSNGDQFGLVPDCFWYEVIHCTKDSHTEPTESKEDMTNEHKTKNSDNNVDKNSNTQLYNQEEEEEDMLDCSESLLDAIFDTNFDLPQENDTSTVKEPENGPEKPTIDKPEDIDTTITNQPDESTNQPDESTNQPNESANHSTESTRSVTPTKRLHSEENSHCDVKRVKTEPEDSPSKDSKDEVKHPCSPETSNKAVKTEPCNSQDVKPGPSNVQGGPSSDGNGSAPAMPPSPTKPPNKLLRERCMYGANCYRRNPQHKVQFSHPTDADWGLGERGTCPWGASCQKTDPRHWRDHDHPPGTRPVGPRPNRPGRRQRRQRSSTSDSDSEENANLVVAGKRMRRQIVRQDWSDSENEDPFHTDDSDEWEPPSDVASQEFSQDSGLQSQPQSQSQSQDF